MNNLPNTSTSLAQHLLRLQIMAGWIGLLVAGDTSVGMAQDRLPNVIVILTDDQGSIDANCYGAFDLVTPGIDQLARHGVRFTQFYSAAPVCSPSRAGLLTGRHPVRAGVPGNVSSKQGHGGMPTEQVTMAEMLKPLGYATAHIGKWHLGYTPNTMPNGQGFDFSFGHMGGCIDNYSHFFYWNGPNRHDLWRNGEEVFRDGLFFADLMVREAQSFIHEHREQPFYIYFALNSPHYPYQGEARWLKHYESLEYPRNLYAAFLTTLDRRIQALVQTIDNLGLRDDTIIVFQSDHGHSTEQRAHFGGGNAGPYRGAKFSLFEGGIRVPAIISWPGKLPQGASRDQVAHSCDWMATLAELCGASINHAIDGKSLVDVIKNEDVQSPHDTLHWSHGKSWAVRQGNWKLIANPKDTSQQIEFGPEDQMYLVDLSSDLGERNNVAAQHGDLVKRLANEHKTFVAGLAQ